MKPFQLSPRTYLVGGILTVALLATGALAYVINVPSRSKTASTSSQTSSPTPSTMPQQSSPVSPSPSDSPSPAQSATPSATASLTPDPNVLFILTGSVVTTGVQLNWQVKGHDVSQGFKLIIASSPTIMGSNFSHISDPTRRSAIWKVGDGQLRYFKVCGYHKDDSNGVSGTTGCSNTISLNTIAVAAETSGYITLLQSSVTGFHWNIEGYAPYGVRLVWASHTGPAYPVDSGQDYAPVWSNTGSGGIPNISGTWYTRACMITADHGCSNYSDEKVITIP